MNKPASTDKVRVFIYVEPLITIEAPLIKAVLKALSLKDIEVLSIQTQLKAFCSEENITSIEIPSPTESFVPLNLDLCFKMHQACIQADLTLLFSSAIGAHLKKSEELHQLISILETLNKSYYLFNTI